MIEHIQQPEDSKVCGQTCVAIAAEISLKKAIKLFGHERGTRTKEILAALNLVGIGSKTDKLQRWDGISTPPKYALLHARFDLKGEKYHGHWLLNWDGVIHDPGMDVPGLIAGGRLTAYVELVPPKK